MFPGAVQKPVNILVFHHIPVPDNARKHRVNMVFLGNGIKISPFCRYHPLTHIKNPTFPPSLKG